MTAAAADDKGETERQLIRRSVCSEFWAKTAPSFRALAGAEAMLPLRMYREMKRVRLLDERMVLLQRQGRVGFYGACTGQEAAVVGAASPQRPEDWIFPALRENAIMLVRGFSLSSFIAQIYGNARDPPKGRQMPEHMSSRSVHQVSWSSCIGTAASPRGRRRLGRQAARRSHGHARVSRRRRHERVRFSRRAELRRRVPGSRGARLSEQPLGDQRARRSADRLGNDRRQGARLRHPWRAGRRQRRASPSTMCSPKPSSGRAQGAAPRSSSSSPTAWLLTPRATIPRATAPATTSSRGPARTRSRGSRATSRRAASGRRRRDERSTAKSTARSRKAVEEVELAGAARSIVAFRGCLRRAAVASDRAAGELEKTPSRRPQGSSRKPRRSKIAVSRRELRWRTEVTTRW